MHTLAYRLAGDRDRLAPSRPNLAIGRNGELQRNMRAAIAHALQMSGMVVPRLLGDDADLDDNAGRTKPGVAGTGNLRIRIFER
jgi:hypothetical protein